MFIRSFLHSFVYSFVPSFIHSLGWLFQQEEVILAMTGLPAREEGSAWHAGEAQTVTVVGLREGGEGEEADCNAQDLSMLFRLQGEEALAEVTMTFVALTGSLGKLHVLCLS